MSEPDPPRAERHWFAPRWLLLASVVLFVVGGVVEANTDDSTDVGDRGRPASAEVRFVALADDGLDAKVHLEWRGTPIDATVFTKEPVVPGRRLRVLVDPQHPQHVWTTDEDAPGGDAASLVYALGFVVLVWAVVAKVVARRRARRPAVPTPPPGGPWMGVGAPAAASVPPPPPPAPPPPPPPPAR
jgi:hypothetical protein